MPQGTSSPVTVSGIQPLQADTAPMHHSDMSVQLSRGAPKSNQLASLTLLPGIALACIFHHLDYTSAHRLAATCQACAAEFEQQKADLTGRHWACLTAGDDIAYRVDCLPDDIADDLEKLADGFEPQAGKLNTSSLGPGSLGFLPERVAKVFKPYTCEMETLDWFCKRQSAKSKGHAKLKRSGQAARPSSRKRHM